MAMEYRPLDLITSDEISAVGISSDDAKRLCSELAAIIDEHGSSGPATWTSISRRLLNPDQPFAFHQMMYYGCYKGYHSDTPPAWIPDRETAVKTNIGQVLERRGKELLGMRYKDPISSFSDFQEFSTLNPEAYWNMVLEEMRISFFVRPSCILQENTCFPGGQWLPGAVLNSAWNCLNLNDKRSMDDVVIIWRDEGDDSLPVHRMSLKELRAEVCLVANAIETLGLSKGSAIAIDMPMTVTAVIIYLAIVLAGFVVVSIADSFAPVEISTRLTISSAKAIFTQDFIVRGDKKHPLYSRVIDANAPRAIVIPTTVSTYNSELRSGDISWLDFLGRVKCSEPNEYAAVEQPVGAFTNILFSSGTTGEPKAIPWTHATPIKAAADAWCHMDIHKGDVVAWPTNLGWMMGPWLVYATFLNGASMALYNGSPLGSGFAKFVQDAKVTMLGVVPSIVRAWKNANCTAGFDWSNIRCFSSSGEASSVNEYLWLMGRAQYKPVIEYCGGTEIGGGFVSGSLLQPQALSAFSTPAMGCTLLILDGNGNPLPRNTAGIGELALEPTIFGASSTLLNADHYNVYYKGMPVWNGKMNSVYNWRILQRRGRADDTMNLGGIKVSSIEIERVCNGVNNAILETAAFGVPPFGGGPEQLVIAVVFKDQTSSSQINVDQLKQAFNSSLQKKLNPLFKVSDVLIVPSLPRTASNKVMRRVLRQQFSQLSKHSKF
ncbi:hypothetical protein J5N97_005167 [Dioscorea zingiberensis]|uniref:4-coumarate--CoA ligase n=1 Tax=Dioscorea zingiberensis TaxID=325984 RepID=A0A9D5D7L2_9LILI|nr:hypothetical protein J5N97_005167 [Dioscorea zingiberensis]